MAKDFARYNDGSSAAPRLRVGHSLWSLIKLPFNAEQEWTLAEKFERVKAAGFETVECWLDDNNEKEIKAELDKAGLGLVMGHRPFSVEDSRKAVERAVRLGCDFLFAQPSNPYVPVEEVATIVREGRKIANDNGIVYFVECHRNNYTETIPNALLLLDHVPDIRFNGDFSHFVVVGEFYGWKEEGAIGRMLPILERTSHLHGRISSGEQVQVDVGDGSNDTAQFFVEIWATCMKSWLKGAGPGDIFQFSSELGPPRYSITDLQGKEISDRWEQSLVMKKLAEQAWNKASEA